MTNPCKHPQVRVVARQDDTEFVECQSCREVFDAIEYEDMVSEALVLSNDDVNEHATPSRKRR